jgi:phosphatidylglycerol lysyltransferase
MTATITPHPTPGALDTRSGRDPRARVVPRLPQPQHDRPDPPSGTYPSTVARTVATWGRSSVSPFNIGHGREFLGDPGFYGTGFVRRGRWAVMATDIAAAPGHEETGLDLTLDLLAHERLRPTFAAVTDPTPYRDRGMWTAPIAADPIIDLTGFDLAGSRRANIRHSVTSARRCGLRVLPWSHELRDQAAAVSDAWLATKRGGEMGFTLGRFDPDGLQPSDCRVAVDESGRVVGFVTWHHYHDSRGRVLDLMRRLPDAPNPTIDLLIADGLLEFAAAGVETASLGCVPHSHGPLAEKLYPTISLHRYKAKFDPCWEQRHLVAPSRRELPGALIALGRSYLPGGLVTFTRRNG